MASLLPAMTQEKLDNQRDVVKNERRWRVDNQPYGDWVELIQALVYPPGHPYHHSTIGSMEDLSAASLEDVGEFFRTWYVPNNAVLTIAGDFETDSALEMVRRHFGPIPANAALPPPPEMDVEPLLGEVRERKADQVPLPRIYLAHRIPPFGTDAFDALDVAADILGSGRASRLYAALVREQRLAQDVGVFTFPLVGGASIFTLWVTARPGVATEAIEAATLAEIRRLADDGPTDADFERVRNLHAAYAAGALERIGERADRLSMYACLFDAPERINTDVSRYAAVDAERVHAGLRDSIRGDNRVTLTYLPAEAAT
jgi:predicted Zn-dependent peptidase